MVWIKTKEGYVRKDAIIDVHISQYYPKTVYFLLTSGDSIKFADFTNEEAAWATLESVVNELSAEV